MAINEELIKLLHDNIYVYRAIEDKWPQLNHRTRIQMVPDTMLQHALPSNVHIWNPKPYRARVWVTIPDQGFKAAFMRWLGDKLDKRSWGYRRAYVWYSQESPIMGPERRVDIRLERMGWSDGRDEYRMAMAYYAAEDTLFIYERDGQAIDVYPGYGIWRKP